MPPLRRNTRKPDEGPVHLTEGGLERMQKHLAELKASLPHLIEEASQAAAQGDRSDNDAYKQSKGLLRHTHRQIWSIEDQLKRAVVIEAGRNAEGTVHIGSTVALAMPSGERQTFEIVGSRETDPSRGRISHESPLGKALIGHRKNETILMESLNGLRQYKILEVN